MYAECSQASCFWPRTGVTYVQWRLLTKTNLLAVFNALSSLGSIPWLGLLFVMTSFWGENVLSGKEDYWRSALYLSNTLLCLDEIFSWYAWFSLKLQFCSRNIWDFLCSHKTSYTLCNVNWFQQMSLNLLCICKHHFLSLLAVCKSREHGQGEGEGTGRSGEKSKL